MKFVFITPQGSLGCVKITPGIPGVYEDYPRDPWGV